ncbi:MAG: succinate dehydrogenase/fumarate reductase iron-sulfur subunit [Promethearchaeota archaeon]
MLFRIARSRKGGGITHYDLYKVDSFKGMTVLDALFQIQDSMDESLSFRYSCRGAVCGSCAMLIDKVPRLACRTQVNTIKDSGVELRGPFSPIASVPLGWNSEEEILIEPLPNLRILKDLVVDMNAFYNALKIMELWVEPPDDEEPRLQKPEERKRIDRYVNCIMCALCYGSCPINERKKEYIGPAALAKAYRFYEDSRIDERNRFLNAAKAPNGAPLCELVMNCVRVCPKGVAPGGAIRKIKNL